MAIIVVGGSSRGAGKTALVCGLIAALPEFRWTAVKVTTHDHGQPKPIWEEKTAGQRTDTARYLAAGAERALLVATQPDELGRIAHQLLQNQKPQPYMIFESNSILSFLQPDLCLAVLGGLDRSQHKPSFSQFVKHSDAMVAHSDADRMLGGDENSKPIFHLAAFERISPETQSWLLLRLHPNPRPRAMLPTDH